MRSVLRTAAATGAVMLALLTVPAPARADGEYLRITPGTVQAGLQIEIEGFCGDIINLNQATVISDAFGTVSLTATRQLITGRYLHRGIVTVPRDRVARSYLVLMTCPGLQTATTTLNVLSFAVPINGPRAGGGALAGNWLSTNAFTVAGAGVIALGALMLLLRRRKA